MPKSVSIYVPDELVGKMEKLPEVNWSEIARQSIEDYIEKRGRAADDKLQMIEISGSDKQISCKIEPRWIIPKKEVWVAFYIENQIGYDLILDRIHYEVNFAEATESISHGPPICELTDVHLQMGLLINGEKSFCTIAKPKPNVPNEIAEKMLQTAALRKDSAIEVKGFIDFQSRKGLIRRWFHFGAGVMPEFFSGDY